jgi:hypothetical protein
VRREWRARKQTVKGDDQFFRLDHIAAHGPQVAILFHLDDITQGRVPFVDDLTRRDRTELVGFQVDYIQTLLRVTADGTQIGGRMQLRVTERNQARIIVCDLVYRPGTHPPHQAQKTVFLADLWRPAIQVAAEGNPCALREIITAILFPFNVLDQDGDALVIICQAILVAVHERIGVDAAGIYPGNCIGQRKQVFFQCALIGTEDTLVFSRKRSTEIILQQAGRADDQRCFIGVPDQFSQTLQDFRGETVPSRIR